MVHQDVFFFVVLFILFGAAAAADTEPLESGRQRFPLFPATSISVSGVVKSCLVAWWLLRKFLHWTSLRFCPAAGDLVAASMSVWLHAVETGLVAACPTFVLLTAYTCNVHTVVEVEHSFGKWVCWLVLAGISVLAPNFFFFTLSVAMSALLV